jgi:hypothetical protein
METLRVGGCDLTGHAVGVGRFGVSAESTEQVGADVPVVGQRRRGDLGDVVGVGEGLELIAGSQGDITFADLPPGCS